MISLVPLKKTGGVPTYAMYVGSTFERIWLRHCFVFYQRIKLYYQKSIVYIKAVKKYRVFPIITLGTI